jgi:hypothetical protein
MKAKVTGEVEIYSGTGLEIDSEYLKATMCVMPLGNDTELDKRTVYDYVAESWTEADDEETTGYKLATQKKIKEESTWETVYWPDTVNTSNVYDIEELAARRRYRITFPIEKNQKKRKVGKNQES